MVHFRVDSVIGLKSQKLLTINHLPVLACRHEQCISVQSSSTRRIVRLLSIFFTVLAQVIGQPKSASQFNHPKKIIFRCQEK